MDHGGRSENKGKIMSQVEVGGIELCDNLPNPEVLAAQTRNLNETNTLSRTESQNEGGGGRGLIQACPNNNGKKEEEEQEKEEYKVTGKAEEEDVDEVMKEEEEESEGSSCLIHCQSSDTPVTDSSYSETGSLLEMPYPFSPGTSPETTSPVIPVRSPETVYAISPLELCQSDAEADFHKFNTGSLASTTTCAPGPAFTSGPVISTTQTLTSDTRLTCTVEPACITETTDRKAKNISTAEQLITSAEPVVNHGSTCTSRLAGSNPEPITSTAGEFTVTTTRLNTSTAASPMSATTSAIAFTKRPTTTDTESTSTTGPITSNWEQFTSSSACTCFSVSARATGPIPRPALLASLERLAQRGDDTHLPQYLHQIAEAFVLHEDYLLALWCIQLERLYHQRVLDNLNAIQEQWESRCRRSYSNLETQHLDTLKNICQTHCRPRAADAVCASLDFLKPTFEEGGAPPSCPPAHQVDCGMEHRAEDSLRSQSSQPVTPSINSADKLNSPETPEKDRENPNSNSEGRASIHGTELTEEGSEGKEVEEGQGDIISVRGNELHPSTAGEMDQSKPAEKLGGDLGPEQEEEVYREEEHRDVEEAAGTLEMEDEAEEEEGEKQKKRHAPVYQKALGVESLVSGTEVEVQQLQQEATDEKTLHEQTYQKNQETHLQEAHLKQQEELGEMGDEQEEEKDYEDEQMDVFREAATLDDMAKLITVEQMSPASGLISILKKRSMRVDSASGPAGSELRPSKPPAKRRVRFKVPDDGFDNDVGGGDSCLLLFLLCLVTVVISVGGTALYCALGDAHSSVCQDFSRNADIYIGQMQRVIAQIQLWFTPGL